MDTRLWLALALASCAWSIASAQMNGDLRLVDRFNNTAGVSRGRLEFFYNESWGTVCDDGFQQPEAEVACRQLGFASVAELLLGQVEGSGPIFLDQVSCAGSETRLIDCNRNEIGINDCNHSEDVGLECSDGTFPTSTPPNNGNFTTSPPNVCFEGQIEQNYEAITYNSYDQNGDTYQIIEYEFNYCSNGVYGRLCAADWDDTEANVLCREFGNLYDYIGEALSEASDGLSPVAAVSVSCNGSESSLSQCSSSPNNGCSSDSTVAGLRCTQVPPVCSLDVKFTNQTLDFSSGLQVVTGRVDVCVNGSYSALCDVGFDIDDAVVGCNYFGYPSPYWEAEVAYGGAVETSWDGTVSYQDTMCNGTETNPLLCPVFPVTDPSCYSTSRLAAVRCTEVLTQCFNDGEFILANRTNEVFGPNGEYSFTARVDVCYNGSYGSVCDIGFDETDARVLCRNSLFSQVGFGFESVSGSANGVSRAGLVLEEVRCTGTEEGLHACPTSPLGDITNPSCTNAAAVTCSRVCYDADVRVVEGERYGVGRVEVCKDNVWGTICDEEWDNLDATVACRAFRFDWGGEAILSPPGNGPLLASGVSCLGNEYTLSECGNDTLLNPICTHAQDAGVVCNPGSVDVTVLARGSNTIGSTNFFLRCDAYQRPWRAGLLVNEWSTDFENPLSNTTERTIAYRVEDRLTFGNDFVLNGSLSFNPLRVEHLGVYSCLVSLNLTYPDGPNNSSAIITNTTTFELLGRGPSPSISVTTDPLIPLEGSPFSASCIVGTTSDLVGYLSVNWTTDMPLDTTRVFIAPPRAINSTHVALDAVFSSLLLSDTGFYTCEAVLSGQYLSRTSTSFPVFLDVQSNTSSPSPVTTETPFAPMDGDLRLVDRFNNTVGVSRGRLEFFYNESWGTVCDDGFQQPEAEVACRQLGFASVAELLLGQVEGSGPILLDQVSCAGSETRLIDCNLINEIGINDCNHSEDVGLECSDGTFPTSTPPNNGNFTTSPPNVCFEGQIEQNYEGITYNSYDQNGDTYQIIEYEFNYCSNGVYGRLCAADWDDTEANVLCREFGNYDYIGEALSEASDGLSPVAAVSVSCNGSESSLSQCSSSPNNGCSSDSTVARLRCTQVPPVCSLDVKFTNQTLDFSSGLQVVTGRVDVCVNGSYSALCDVGFDIDDAVVGCNYFGYPSPYWEAEVAYGGAVETSWDGTVSYQDTMCNGTETNPLLCPVSPVTDPNCYSTSRLAAVRCTEVLTQCFNDGEFILANRTNEVFGPNGEYSFTARVDVCYNGSYGSVCDIGFDETDARVLCRNSLFSQVGFGFESVSGSANGVSRAGLVLEEVRCTGTEEGLHACPTSPLGDITNPSCTNAAAVTCSRVCYDADVRVVEGERYGVGRVEVCKDNVWGTICDEEWDNLDATVACRAFRFDWGGEAILSPPGNGPLLASGVSCLGNEYTLSECGNDTLLNPICTHAQDAGVVCNPGSVDVTVLARGSNTIGSTNFFLRCDAYQRPWRAGLLVNEWSTDFENPLSNTTERTIAYRVEDRLTFGNDFVLNGSLSFNPLRVEHLGVYSCLVSLNLTYPDGPNNSSAIITNTTTFELLGRGPSPSISVTTDPLIPLEGSPFSASCIVGTTSDLVGYLSVNWTTDMPLDTTRVFIAPPRAINSTHVALDAVFSSLLLSDTGFYTCEAVLSGQYLSRTSTSFPVFLDVQSNTSSPSPVTTETPFAPMDGDLRLVDRFNNTVGVSRGRLEFFYNESWGTVCDDGFQQPEAEVACRQLGFASVAELLLGQVEGSGPILLDQVSCAGSETRLIDCNLINEIGINDCNHSEDVGLECSDGTFPTSTPPNNGNFTTSPPNVCFEGQIEQNYEGITYNSYDQNGDTYQIIEYEFNYCSNGVYGRLCAADWDDTEANVLCREFGNYDYIGEALSEASDGLSPVAAVSVSCNGSESSLSQCSSSPNNGCSSDSTVARLRCTQVPPVCSLDVKFTNQTLDFSSGLQVVTGRVDVCVNGSYSALCDVGFDIDDAVVGCNYFGYPSPYWEAEVAYGGAVETSWDGTVSYQDTMCNGTETNPLLCPVSPVTDPNCYSTSRLAAVRCTEVLTQCFNDGEFILANRTNEVFGPNGEYSFTARVDVCYNGSYGSVCDIGFDETDARVLCRNSLFSQVGFGFESVSGSANGVSRAGLVLEEVRCTGTEEGLHACPTSPLGDITNPSCTSAAAVTCSRVCYDADVRVVEGERYGVGRVEVCKDNVWGTICDEEWDNLDATVACRAFRFDWGGEAILSPPGNGPILASGVSCLGNEYTLSECGNDTLLNPICTHAQDAGVVCNPGSVDVTVLARGSNTIGSTNFVLRCDAYQRPWRAGLLVNEWSTDFENPLSNTTERTIAYRVEDRLTFGNDFVLNGSLSFNPLRVEHLGVYSCLVSLNLTYPDGPNNSSAIITNTTTFELLGRGPSPSISVTTDPLIPLEGSPFSASCIVGTTSDLVGYLSVNWTTDMPLDTTRVFIAPPRAINSTHVALDAVFSSLLLSDTGFYTCEAVLSGQYLSRTSTSFPVFLDVPNGNTTASPPTGNTTAGPPTGNATTASPPTGNTTAGPPTGNTTTASPPTGNTTAGPPAGNATTASPPTGNTTAGPPAGNATTASPPTGNTTAGPPAGNATTAGPSTENATTASPPTGNTTAGPPTGNTTAGPPAGNATTASPPTGNTTAGPPAGNATTASPPTGNTTAGPPAGNATTAGPSTGNATTASPPTGNATTASPTTGTNATGPPTDTTDAGPCQLTDNLSRALCTALLSGDLTAVSEILVSATEDENGVSVDDLVAIASTIASLLNGPTPDIPSPVLMDYEKVINNLLQVDEQLIAQAQPSGQFTAKVTDSIEEVTLRLPLTDNTATLVSTRFALATAQVDKNSFNGLVFNSRSLATGDGSKTTADVNLSPEADESSTSTLSLPPSLFTQLSAPDTTYRLLYSSFATASFFPPADPQMKVSSDVISASVNGLVVSNLDDMDPVTLRLRRVNPDLGLTDEALDARTVCVYWDFALNSGSGDWSAFGCKMAGRDQDGRVTCECNHLSSFALLVNVQLEATVRPSTVPPSPEPVVGGVQVIVYVGLAVALVALLISLLSHLFSKKVRSSDPGVVVINMCISLLGLYIVFIISAQAPHLNANNPPHGANVCAFFSALLQYFTLSFFCLTAVEALLILGEQTVMLKHRYFLPVALAVAWLLPLAIVAICMGGYEYYVNVEFCRPSAWPFWVGFAASFAIVTIINWTVFAMATCGICLHCFSSSNEAKKSRVSSHLSHLLIAVILSVIFSVAWIFFLISVADSFVNVSVAAQYIYAIFFAVHSVLLLVLYAVRSPDTRSEWVRLWYILTCNKDTYHVRQTALSGEDSTRRGTYLSNKSPLPQELESGVQLKESSSLAAPEFTKGPDTSFTVENTLATTSEMVENEDIDEKKKLDSDHLDEQPNEPNTHL
ncbi:deleted in malignant brain tumors 1 protein-like isoform X5 [Halichondria panicea]|uniref:deleted in malignant brain tumors 1 protein-like isoform X5 n=1 Tax=Halichondria panicea TaxID=6063 RepID=UPI00312B465D